MRFVLKSLKGVLLALFLGSLGIAADSQQCAEHLTVHRPFAHEINFQPEFVVPQGPDSIVFGGDANVVVARFSEGVPEHVDEVEGGLFRRVPVSRSPTEFGQAVPFLTGNNGIVLAEFTSPPAPDIRRTLEAVSEPWGERPIGASTFYPSSSKWIHSVSPGPDDGGIGGQIAICDVTKTNPPQLIGDLRGKAYQGLASNGTYVAGLTLDHRLIHWRLKDGNKLGASVLRTGPIAGRRAKMTELDYRRQRIVFRASSKNTVIVTAGTGEVAKAPPSLKEITLSNSDQKLRASYEIPHSTAREFGIPPKELWFETLAVSDSWVAAGAGRWVIVWPLRAPQASSQGAMHPAFVADLDEGSTDVLDLAFSSDGGILYVVTNSNEKILALEMNPAQPSAKAVTQPDITGAIPSGISSTDSLDDYDDAIDAFTDLELDESPIIDGEGFLGIYQKFGITGFAAFLDQLDSPDERTLLNDILEALEDVPDSADVIRELTDFMNERLSEDADDDLDVE